MNAIRLERDAAGIAWVVFDDPASKVNLLSRAVVAELGGLLDELAAHEPTGVVFISGKPDSFITGADPNEALQGAEWSQAGQACLAKLASLAVPTVAAIDGACLGAGCELALACRYRIASDLPRTQFALPATQLGMIPGWGGTQRLPEVVGLRTALDLLVSGRTIDGKRAARVGLVDAVVPGASLREVAGQLAATGVLPGMRRHRRRSVMPDAWVRWLARRHTRKQTRGHYPAPLKVIDVAGRGYAAETAAFGELAASPACRGLMQVAALREKHSRLKAGETTLQVWQVGVVGAGVMGAGIAHWCGACGLSVRLKDARPELVAAGMRRIAQLYRAGLRGRRVSEAAIQQELARVQAVNDYAGLKECDLVIEAVTERSDVKRAVLGELMPGLRPDCVVASNTSAIRIDELAAASGRPERFVGLHFFNPVHRMPLVEVVRGTQTDPAVLAGAVDFVHRIRKLPLIVSGTPGFLVNRLLMPYLNEAGRLLDEGVGLPAIDGAMVEFGMPMGPLRLIDEIGIDVTYEVSRELAAAFPWMNVAPAVKRLHDAGLKGRKGGRGFYVHAGKKANPAFSGKSAVASELQKRLLGVMIAEARRCLEDKVVATGDDVDAGMLFGAGFPPFRGGLVTYARTIGAW